jgi:hypothetical protein
MLTKFQIDESINFKEQPAIAIGSNKITNKKKAVKLLLPQLMPNIDKGKKDKSNISAGKISTSMLANAKGCKPKPSNKVIKCRNYLEGELANNSSVKNKSKAKKDKNGNVSSRNLKHGTTLRAKFLDGMISKLRANTDE